MCIKAQILLVEDHADLRLMLGIMLNRNGYGVITAGTVAEGMELAGKTAFDLYILDNQLPDGSGQELREHLRVMTPQTPVLYFTGEAYDDGAVKALKSGGDGYLLKPVCPDDLQTAIERLLQPQTDLEVKLQTQDPCNVI